MADEAPPQRVIITGGTTEPPPQGPTLGPFLPSDAETAIISTGSFTWRNWETVMVQHRYMEAFPVFEFSAVEPATEPATQAQLLFNVGQLIKITLGGQPAISGIISIRQSAMDGERHGLQLIGKGWTWQMAKSSIRGQGSSFTYDFSGQNIVQIAQTICAETGVTCYAVGNVDLSPFPSLVTSPGEPAFDFLERIARQRQTIIGSDPFGGLTLNGPQPLPQGADLRLSKTGNIKKINVVISNETVFANYWSVGQMTGSDSLNGEAAAQLFAGPVSGPDASVSHLVAPMEDPGNQGDVQKRAAFEALIHNSTEIKITIGVNGWLQPSGILWQAGAQYVVDAPDHLPTQWNKQPYAAQVVTFQQDDENGTTTTLELVLPQLLGGNYFNVGAAAPNATTIGTTSPNPNDEPAATFEQRFTGNP
jgi:prophage tail gpP-like protein